MLKKILLPLGGNEEIGEISSFIASLAPDRRIVVRGLGIVDIEGIAGSLSGAPIGAIGMAEEARKKISSKEKTRIKRFVSSLEKKLEKKKIEYEFNVSEGDPREEIFKRSVGSDLLVIHSGSIFSYSKEKMSVGFFCDVISRSRVPVMFLGGNTLHGDMVGIAYDFGMDAFHAFYSFLHLGILTKSKILFSHVSSEESTVRRFAPYQAYFELHGFENVSEVILKGEKEAAIRRFVETENVGLLVLGKKGESRLADYLFGTLTNALISDPPCSLYIHE